jgi:hypothetical protein
MLDLSNTTHLVLTCLTSLTTILVAIQQFNDRKNNKVDVYKEQIAEIKTHISVLEERMTVQHSNVHEMLIRLDDKLERIKNAI